MRVSLLALAVLAAGAAPPTSPSPPRTAERVQPAPLRVSPEYEVLRPEAAWCGPRVLFFLAHYLGESPSLDDVVSLCRTDADGYTTLQNLVEAARQLGLEPTPIHCDARQLLALGGPAIIGVGRPDAPGQKELRTHFVGLIGRQGDRYLVTDPSLRAEPGAVSEERIGNSFTGHAILLRGCPRPFIWPERQQMRSLGFGATGATGVLIAVLGWRRWRRKPFPGGLETKG